MISTSGLATYPAAGDTFSAWVRGTNNADDINVTYGVQDHDNRYFVNVEFADGAIRFSRYENASSNILAADSGFTLSEDTWYELEIDWASDGTHTVRIYAPDGTQLGQCAATDNTWTSGGFGYDGYFAGSNATAYFDHATLASVRLLGGFESDLDGWSADSGNSLARVSGTQEPAPVTHGDYALEVTTNGDSEPIINTQRIRSADLSNHPCLLADVLPASVENTDSPVTFRFRYHHTDPGGVEESPEMTVSQKHGGRICWDMSGLSSTKLANPDRLDIAWYPEEHPPGSGFDYNGVTYVDNAFLTDDRNQVTHGRWVRKQCDLERAYGLMTDQVIQSESDTAQEGVYQYQDGTEVSYKVEKLQNGDVEESCDGDTFRWGGVVVMVTKTERANVVTTLFGYDENEDLRSSAIPWIFDEWFHGDFDTAREQSLSDALGEKTLEEYTSSENPFPDFRINSVVEISFDTSDDQTISNPTATTTDPEDSTTPGGLSPVTLEGASDEPENPLRTTYDYDGSQNYLNATAKGPHTAETKVTVDSIEGYRASLILGGSDPYLEKLKGDVEDLAAFTGADVPAFVGDYFFHVTTFYSFIDFVFMADGTKLVRVWDASVYPAHALYVGGEKVDQNEFDEGDEWVTQGLPWEHDAFKRFADESHQPGVTPFDQFGSYDYRNCFVEGSGSHPVGTYLESGTSLSARNVQSTLSEPLFPPSIDSPT